MDIRSVVLVLGDLGLSPRMQYHARSLSMLDESFVTAIGFEGEKCFNELLSRKNVNIVRISSFDFKMLRAIPFLHAIVKGFALLGSILWTLFSLGSSYDVVIVQNPPSIPALFAALALSRCINGSAVLLDWHNLGFKMFENRLGPKHIIVRISRAIEFFLAHQCDGHLCVSESMQSWLSSSIGISPVVAYDKPASMFSRCGTNISDRHSLFLKLGLLDDELFNLIMRGQSDGDEIMKIYPESRTNNMKSISNSIGVTEGGNSGLSTIQTMRLGYGAVAGPILFRSDPAPLIISATSWTPDEDFDLFIRALLLLEDELRKQNERDAISLFENIRRSSAAASADAAVPAIHSYDLDSHGASAGPSSCTPRAILSQNASSEGRESSKVASIKRVAVVITGKGPMKAAFEETVKDLKRNGRLKYVAIVTAWLEPQDYPLLMGCADLGVSLHTSTSGLDLPMKVLDMFGSGVPVCAASFPALNELVRDGQNGYSFGDATELCSHICRLLFGIQILKSSSPQPASASECEGIVQEGDSNVNKNNHGDTSAFQGAYSRIASSSSGSQSYGYPFTAELTRLGEGAREIGNWDVQWDQSVKPVVLQMFKLAMLRRRRAKTVWKYATYATIMAVLILAIFTCFLFA